MTMEVTDLFYLKLQADWKVFQLVPLALEVQEPEWLTGEHDRILELGLESCSGGYSSILAFPMQIELTMNVKHCETSVYDWVTGKGDQGPGLHVYCYYDEDHEITLARPI